MNFVPRGRSRSSGWASDKPQQFFREGGRHLLDKKTRKHNPRQKTDDQWDWLYALGGSSSRKTKCSSPTASKCSQAPPSCVPQHIGLTLPLVERTSRPKHSRRLGSVGIHVNCWVGSSALRKCRGVPTALCGSLSAFHRPSSANSPVVYNAPASVLTSQNHER